MWTWWSCSRTTLRLVQDHHRTEEEQQWHLHVCTHHGCRVSRGSTGSTRHIKLGAMFWALCLCVQWSLPWQDKRTVALIVREAHHCGGNGWREYDTMFRQQASLAAELEWRKLDRSLYTFTFLAHQSGRSRICKWCLDTDHHSGECALEPADKVGSSASPGVELKQNSGKRDKASLLASATHATQENVVSTPIAGCIAQFLVKQHETEKVIEKVREGIDEMCRHSVRKNEPSYY